MATPKNKELILRNGTFPTLYFTNERRRRNSTSPIRMY